jgi:hypothetical protein
MILIYCATDFRMSQRLKIALKDPDLSHIDPLLKAKFVKQYISFLKRSKFVKFLVSKADMLYKL